MKKQVITKKIEELLRKIWDKYSDLIFKDCGIIFKKLTFDILAKNEEIFLKNEYYMLKYEKAPSDLCKFYIAVIYCRSLDEFRNKTNKDSKLALECMMMEEYIEYFLDIKDYEYLRDHFAGMVQAKIIYNEIINEKMALRKGEKLLIKPHGREIMNPYFQVKYNAK